MEAIAPFFSEVSANCATLLLALTPVATGRGNGVVFADLWSFEGNVWTQLLPIEAEAGAAASARYGHAAAMSNGFLFIIGGQTSTLTVAESTTHALEVYNTTWVQVQSTGFTGRGGSAAATLTIAMSTPSPAAYSGPLENVEYYTSSILVFGGVEVNPYAITSRTSLLVPAMGFCEEGYYHQARSQCAPCQEGTFSLKGAYYCTECSAGTYASFEASSSCTDCQPGRYGITVGASSPNDCMECDAGYFSSGYGETSCTICNEGNGWK